ncbi:MAG TPA: sigma factor, partial [Acidimicrobiales bacterium]|nr:sigma factor [Acidimicrobiales bacterium]
MPDHRERRRRRTARGQAASPVAGERGGDTVDPRFAEYRATRDRSIRNELVEDHRWLALHCARQFARKGEPLEDLVQVAMVGVLKAVDRFDP